MGKIKEEKDGALVGSRTLFLQNKEAKGQLQPLALQRTPRDESVCFSVKGGWPSISPSGGKGLLLVLDLQLWARTTLRVRHPGGRGPEEGEVLREKPGGGRGPGGLELAGGRGGREPGPHTHSLSEGLWLVPGGWAQVGPPSCRPQRAVRSTGLASSHCPLGQGSPELWF